VPLTDYTGATRRLDPAAGLALDPRRFGWQLKHDGCYVRLSLDARGRIASRNRPISFMSPSFAALFMAVIHSPSAMKFSDNRSSITALLLRDSLPSV
jgi:hypothetical protein